MTYNNRLNTGKCVPCSKLTPSTPTPTPPVIKPETTISNISCGASKILSITKVKDKVVVMLDDCSYMTAPLSVVDTNFCAELAEENEQTINELTAKLTRLEEQVNTLGSKEDKDTVYDDTVISEKVSKVETKLNNLVNSLVNVEDLNGDTSFKVINKAYKGN